ncbi:DUF1489 family protein [Croceicoccus marinus]|jgi:hypothetical protein|uniref:DUF1489 domain-containing protein n=1 Tax=Croceicoccus marinus TaxID=450378 RepID=A0A1Z1F8P3_9SPHN|nr:DUF1489 domain-containing protein [Croceicoccus marinus]ARU15168.1 hypothetical protein A9D14_01980 [Croceicoccus marinus]QNE06578.1 DUF1489 domain-containing protein [Croceicoccus marinus]
MPLHLTKIAFGAQSYDDIEGWFANRPRLSLNTRYCPKRVEELEGGSLYWIHEHALVARSPITGFEQQDNGRWWIHLEPKLIRVQTRPRRAHQGWRYLKDEDAPADLAEGEEAGDVLPGRLLGQLTKLGLV